MFLQGALYQIGSTMTLFSTKNKAYEFLSVVDKNFKKNDSSDYEDESVEATIIIKQNNYIFDYYT